MTGLYLMNVIQSLHLLREALLSKNNSTLKLCIQFLAWLWRFQRIGGFITKHSLVLTEAQHGDRVLSNVIIFRK